MRFRYARNLAILCCLHLLQPPPAAFAESSPASSTGERGALPPTGDLTAEQAVALALRASPDLRAQASLLRAEEANVRRSGLRENPTLDFSGENFAGTGEYRGVERLEATVSLSQRVEIGSDRELRRQRAEAQKDVESIRFEIAKRDLVSAVNGAFIDTLEAQAALEVEREGLAISERLEGAVARRARAGGGSPADISNAAIDLARVRLRLASAEDGLSAARARLGSLWGEASPGFGKAVGSLAAPTEFPDIDDNRIEQSLALAESRAEHQLGLAAVADASAEARPDLTLSGGVRYFRDEGRVAAVFGASIPIPVSGASGVDEARERASAAQSRAEASRARLKSELALLRARFQSAHRELRALDDTLLPKSTEGLTVLEKAYALGGTTYAELAGANRSLIEFKTRRVAVVCEMQRLRYRYEQLVGQNNPGR